MNMKRLTYILLIASMLGCNFLNSMLTPATPTPQPTFTVGATETVTPGSLVPAYVPPQCQSTPPATISPATALVQPTPVLQANPEISQDVQEKVFEQVVQIIDRVYVYKDFNGKDWKSIVSNYRTQVNSGLSTQDFYTAMQSMVTELGDEHSYFESPVEVAASQADLAGSSEFVGVGVYVLPQLEKNNSTIIEVFPNSPAEYGGLKPHDSLLKIDGVPVTENGESNLFLARGPECTATVLTVRSPGGEPRDVLLYRQKIQSPLLIDARLVPTSDGSKIGYIMLPTFFDETIPGQVEEALKNFGHLDGLILDNRLNGGGSSDVVEPILSFFTSGTLGHFVSREESRPLEIKANPIENSQDVPLVVMVSPDTVSFGEIFSGVLKDIGRAKVVGQTSAGNVELLHGYDLPDGSQLWIAQETFHPEFSKDGWEGTGIVPDVEAIADWDTFTFETDPGIKAALTVLGHQ